MKNQLIYLFLAIGIAFFPQMIFAQESSLSNENNNSSWGLKLGVSNHWQDSDELNFDADFGYLAGMYFKKPLGGFMAVGYEWQIMQMGYRIDETNIQELEKIIINRTYIHAIFNFHLTPVEFFDISFGLYGGGAVSSNTQRYFTSGLDESDGENNLREFDAGAKFNVSLQLNKIGLGLEYYHGLINTHIESEFAFTNRAISLSARYFIE